MARPISLWGFDFDDREWIWIIAHIQHLLRMDQEQVKTFKTLLNEDRSMESVVELIMAEGEARGVARGLAEGEARGEARGKNEGKIEGEARLLSYLVSKGRMTQDEARQELRQMATEGLMEPKSLELALQILEAGFSKAN